jgi:hypothetical protein
MTNSLESCLTLYAVVGGATFLLYALSVCMLPAGEYLNHDGMMWVSGMTCMCKGHSTPSLSSVSWHCYYLDG